MNASRVLRLALVLVLCLAPASGLAHKARVFALIENGQIVAEAGFSGGKPATNRQITVVDPLTGETLASGRTDEKGELRIPLPPGADKATTGLRIVFDGGDGHGAEWLLDPAEYLASPPATRDVPPSAAKRQPGQPPQPHQPATACPSLEQIQMVVDATLDRKLAPIRKQLLEGADPGPRLQDILGGIGFLMGLAGLYAYGRSRRR